MPAGTSKQDFMLMLQGLVAERFSLKLHEEERAVSAYSLTVAKGGPKLALGGTSALNAATNKDGFPPGIIPTGSFQNLHFPTGARLAGLQISLDEFSLALAGELKAAVVDETGLSGKYDIALYFSPDSAPASPAPDSATNTATATPEPRSERDIFGAIQKQLGLKLQGGKTNQHVLVVTYANQTPKEN